MDRAVGCVRGAGPVPEPADGPGQDGSLRAAVAETMRFGGAASKALANKKTGNRCCSLRNPEGLP